MLLARGLPVARSCGARYTPLLRRRCGVQTPHRRSLRGASSPAATRGAAAAPRITRPLPIWAAAAAASSSSCSSSSSSSRRWRLLHTVPAVPGDRVVAAELLEKPEDLLQLAVGSSALNLPTLQQILRQLARASRDPAAAAALQQDERLQQLLQQMGLMLQEADGRLLAQIASALALLRVTNLATQQLALQIARTTISKRDCLPPRSLCTLAASLAALHIQDAELQRFVWREVQQQLQQLQPGDMCLLLEAMRRWGTYSRTNCDLLLQRMSEEIDSFTAADVAAAVDAIANMGLARGFLLRQLSSLAFENLQHFLQQQLLLLMRGLGRMRFLTPANCDALLQHFKIDCSNQQQLLQKGDSSSSSSGGAQWTPHQSALLLGALAICDVGPMHSGNRSLLLQLLEHVEAALPQQAAAEAAAAAPAAAAAAGDSAAGQRHRLGLAALVEAAYAICYFAVQEKSDLLQRLLHEVYVRPASKDRVLLMKTQEIHRAVELEMRKCRAQPSLAWRTAFEEAERQAQDRQETSGLHAEVALALDLLRGCYRLQLQRNASCGGYRVDFYDEETCIAIDVDTVYRHAPCTMKHRHLALQGVLPVSIQYWQWRRCRSEEDQLLYLQQRLAPALEQKGRLQPRQFV